MAPHPRPPCLLTTILLVSSLLVSFDALRAQDRTAISLGLGPIASYPEDFRGTGCEGGSVGANVGLLHDLSRHVALDVNVTWTGSTATSCSADALSRPAPEDGTLYQYSPLPDVIRGETFWATRAGAVFTPVQLGPTTTLIRLSAGRLWSKRLWTWTLGAGVRHSFGRPGVVVEVERWHFGYDVVQETWTFRQDAPDELQSRQIIERRPRPWFIRLGLEWTVGS